MKGNRGVAPQDIRKRMQELYVYDLYGFRTEIKALSSILYPFETINAFATGIYKGKRRMIVVTIYRIVVVSTGLASEPDVYELRREDITGYTIKKKFFVSSISVESGEETFEFKMVSRRVLDLFGWAIDQPLPELD